MISIEIKQEDKQLVRIQAIGEGGCQYEVQEEIFIGGRISVVNKFGVISREKGETDKQFAAKLLAKTLK